jgi:hypothetical protein
VEGALARIAEFRQQGSRQHSMLTTWSPVQKEHLPVSLMATEVSTSSCR